MKHNISVPCLVVRAARVERASSLLLNEAMIRVTVMKGILSLDLHITTLNSETLEVSSYYITTCRRILEMLWVGFLELLDDFESVLCLGELSTQLINSLEDERSELNVSNYCYYLL